MFIFSLFIIIVHIWNQNEENKQVRFSLREYLVLDSEQPNIQEFACDGSKADNGRGSNKDGMFGEMINDMDDSITSYINRIVAKSEKP